VADPMSMFLNKISNRQLIEPQTPFMDNSIEANLVIKQFPKVFSYPLLVLDRQACASNPG